MYRRDRSGSAAGFSHRRNELNRNASTEGGIHKAQDRIESPIGGLSRLFSRGKDLLDCNNYREHRIPSSRLYLISDKSCNPELHAYPLTILRGQSRNHRRNASILNCDISIIDCGISIIDRKITMASLHETTVCRKLPFEDRIERPAREASKM